VTEPIDVAHERFVSLQEEVGEYLHSVETEADTRLKIIDRIFTEVLLWPYSAILAEPSTPGGFVDYSMGVDGRSRLIVEAKRDARSLGCEDRQPKRGYRLNGGMFRTEAAKEGISQAIRYCGEKNAELACVTNGREWIIFRGNRLGDGMDTRAGSAFVFSSLVAIEENFTHFYNLLSYEAAKSLNYRPYFQEAEGQPIRMTVFHKALRPQGTARYLKASDLSVDMEKIMSTFFQRLAGDEDPDLLQACFVETNESQHAEGQLIRIAEGLASKVRALDTGRAEALTQMIRRVTETRRHEFVVLVGTKGAGKSTFVTRFFDQVLPGEVADKCVQLKVDLAKSPGDLASVASWLDRELLAESEKQLFGEDSATFNDLEGVFYDEYTRLKKGAWATLYESDHVQFKIKFGDWIEQQRSSNPHEYVEGLLRHIVRNRKMVPVIVFDNTDHFEIGFQQLVYQYARSLYERVICLVMLPITDRTSWQLSKHGALQSFEHEIFFLPTPPTERIIRKRIEFLESRIEATRQRPEETYFLSRGISLSMDDLTAFTRALQRIFLQTSNVSEWMGNLANHDVRRTLTLARAFIVSPHLKVDDLLKAYLLKSAVELAPNVAARALICGHYDVYPTGQQDFVQNVFNLNSDLETSPLLGVRLLQLLADVPVDEHAGGLIDVDAVSTYALGMGLEIRAAHLWLDAMLKSGLCLSYDPTVVDIDNANQIEISPAGRHHLIWAKGEFEYLAAMTQVTPVLDEVTYRDLQSHEANHRWREKTALFIDYLLREDKNFCILPSHDAYQGQVRLANGLNDRAERWRQPAVRQRHPGGTGAAGGFPAKQRQKGLE
jgi:AAA ATPase domain